MVLTDGIDRLEVTAIDVDPARGDLELAFTLQSGVFHCSAANAWIERDDFAAFISALELVERDRRGTATVTSLGDEFKLEIAIVNAAGRTGVSGWVGAQSIGITGRWVESRVGFSFALDPTELPNIVSAARAFLPSTQYCDILQKMHRGDLTREHVENLFNAVDPTIALERWSLSDTERTAFGQGAGWDDLARWRYSGWPVRCSVCDGTLPAVEDYGWFVVPCGNGRSDLRHAGCKPNSG